MLETEIEAFLAIARTNTISAAARRLYLTQPALSRRLKSLEEQLGYPLLRRSKGSRAIELTPEGQAFIPLAEKWQQLFQESQGLAANLKELRVFHLGVLDSMCTYLLPSTFRQFINDHSECHLHIHKYHPDECYAHMERGNLDIALVSSTMYAKNTATIPTFKTKFLLVSKGPLGSMGPVHPSQLNPEKEIRLSWTPEYNIWHDYWFGSTARARVKLDMMSLLEYFINDPELWALTPAYIAHYLQEKYQVQVYDLEKPPQDIIIYSLQPKNGASQYSEDFLKLMRQHLAAHPDITLL